MKTPLIPEIALLDLPRPQVCFACGGKHPKIRHLIIGWKQPDGMAGGSSASALCPSCIELVKRVLA